MKKSQNPNTHTNRISKNSFLTQNSRQNLTQNSRQNLTQNSFPVIKTNKFPNLFTVFAGNLLRVMGINVNKTVNELNIILSNKQSVEQLKKNIVEFIDLTNPLIDETINQIIEKWNEGIKKMGQNLSVSIVEFIPVLGQIIAEITSLQLILSNFLGIFKDTGEIINNTLTSASNRYYYEIQKQTQNIVAAPINKFNKKKRLVKNALVNTVAGPIEKINEQREIAENAVAGQILSAQNTLAAPIEKINEQREIAENAVAGQLLSAQNTLAAPIEKINEQTELAQNAVAGQLLSAQNTLAAPIEKINKQTELAQNTISKKNSIPEEINNSNNKRPKLSGGGAILSRIQKSVKNFMGKKNESINKEFIDKKKTKTSKNIIISQKGGQILSRIHKSLETFNNIKH
jgi:hypothetical protein